LSQLEEVVVVQEKEEEEEKVKNVLNVSLEFVFK